MVGPNRPFADQFPNHVIYALQFFDRWYIASHNPKLGWLPRLHPLVRVVSQRGGVSLDIPFHRTGYYLYPTMANRINSRGQIAGMATDLNDGTIHAFLATPVYGTGGGKVARQNRANVAPKVALPENLRRMLLRGLPFGDKRTDR